MDNMIIRKTDNQGRLNIPNSLLEFLNISSNEQLAICCFGKTMFKMVTKNELKDERILFFTKTDNKGRVLIPKEIRNKIIKFEIFAFKGNIILKGTQ